MKGTSLNQVYTKDKDAELKKRVGFLSPLNNIYIEDGFNIRDIDQEHVDSIAQAFKNGDYVPAIVVKPTTEGLKVIDGHHRFLAATQAEVDRIACDDFVGDELAMMAMMITSSQGRNLLPIERANAYQRMLNRGATKSEISKRTGRSSSDINRHLLLLTASPQVIESLKKNEVGFKAVVEELQRNGNEGNENITKAIASNEGKKVTTSTLSANKFSMKDANAVMELLITTVNYDANQELELLIKKYQES